MHESCTENLRPLDKDLADMLQFSLNGYLNVSAIKSCYKNNDCFYKDYDLKCYSWQDNCREGEW